MNIPSFMIGVSKTPGESHIGAHIVVEKVEGRTAPLKPNDLTEEERERYLEGMDRAKSSVVKYWHNAWENRDRNVIFDLKHDEQFVYGKTKKDEVEKVYLVDIGPGYYFHANNKPSTGTYLFELQSLTTHLAEGNEKTVSEIRNFMSDVERREPDSNTLKLITNIRQRVSPKS